MQRRPEIYKLDTYLSISIDPYRLTNWNQCRLQPETLYSEPLQVQLHNNNTGHQLVKKTILRVLILQGLKWYVVIPPLSNSDWILVPVGLEEEEEARLSQSLVVTSSILLGWFGSRRTTLIWDYTDNTTGRLSTRRVTGYYYLTIHTHTTIRLLTDKYIKVSSDRADELLSYIITHHPDPSSVGVVLVLYPLWNSVLQLLSRPVLRTTQVTIRSCVGVQDNTLHELYLHETDYLH